MKLVSRDVTYDLEDLKKVTIGPDDVIVARIDVTNLNSTQKVQYAEAVGKVLGDTFPANKVVVLNKDIAITIATITP
jgi:anthranilate phosphoribosyltransferase